MTTHKSFSARADIETILAERNAKRIDVPVLQPADPFLDTAGEELRRRIFLTESQAGAAMCLRPEFTIPVCLQHIHQGNGHQRYGYVGTVFRQRADGSSEFLQAGIEDIGDAKGSEADARSVSDCLACLNALDAPKNVSLLVGDQAVFDAVLAALGLPAAWRVLLTHAFGDNAALKATLNTLSQPAKMPIVPDDVQAAIEIGDTQGVVEVVQTHLANASLVNAGGRSAGEIASRLMAKVEAAQTIPDARKLDVLTKFLALQNSLDKAADELCAFAKACDLNIADALSNFESRNAALKKSGVDLSGATYNASFGRSLDYYTGLVYEMRSADGTVLAGGGRYDKLLPLLGAKQPTKGVGFSLWLDRIAEARR